MIRAAALLVLLLPSRQDDSNCDEKEAKIILAQFNKAYGAARDDEGKREGALSFLRQKRHPLLLERLIGVGSAERSTKVRAVCAEALGEYVSTEKAGDALISWLNKTQLKDEWYTLNARILQSIGALKPEVSRKHVKVVNDWIDHKDGNVAKAAVMATSTIRDKSSVEPLLGEMLKCQREMLKFITGEKIDGCDGG